MKAAAHVIAARVRRRRQIVGIAFLNDAVAVINVIDSVGLHPLAALPSIFVADSPPHFPVVRKLREPLVGDQNLDKLILIVPGKRPRPVVKEVAVAIVHVSCVVRAEIDVDGVGGDPAQLVLGYGSVAAQDREIRGGEGPVPIQLGRIGQIDRHIGGAGRGRAHHGYLATVGVRRQFIIAVDHEIGRQLVVGPIL